ncbi:MAG: hypothetical protein PHV55_08415, partial [Candidatus Omnitrophica bacterium]|nr:hypothetical protein [Candidatus Omnitrophota bacterium]
GNISAQIDGKDAIRLTIPSGDPYYSYSAGATSATATANATNCGGCASPYTINYDTGVIS